MTKAMPRDLTCQPKIAPNRDLSVSKINVIGINITSDLLQDFNIVEENILPLTPQLQPRYDTTIQQVNSLSEKTEQVKSDFKEIVATKQDSEYGRFYNISKTIGVRTIT
jgi:hypothetical protein